MVHVKPLLRRTLNHTYQFGLYRDVSSILRLGAGHALLYWCPTGLSYAKKVHLDQSVYRGKRSIAMFTTSEWKSVIICAFLYAFRNVISHSLAYMQSLLPEFDAGEDVYASGQFPIVPADVPDAIDPVCLSILD